jgi:hypothetical protein
MVFGVKKMPSQMFSNESFFSLAGASAIVFVVCNALQSALNFNPKWLGLALSEVVAILGVWTAPRITVPSDYFIALLNGCLIFCTAAGGTSVAASAKEAAQPKGVIVPAKQSRGFAERWL